MPGSFKKHNPGPGAKGMNPTHRFNDGGAPVFEYPWSIIGITKDSTGAALGSCVVQVFRTTDDAFFGQTVSDAAGNYTLWASPLIAHYLVAYKAGAPDVAGTSVNTVVGA